MFVGRVLNWLVPMDQNGDVIELPAQPEARESLDGDVVFDPENAAKQCDQFSNSSTDEEGSVYFDCHGDIGDRYANTLTGVKNKGKRSVTFAENLPVAKELNPKIYPNFRTNVFQIEEDYSQPPSSYHCPDSSNASDAVADNSNLSEYLKPGSGNTLCHLNSIMQVDSLPPQYPPSVPLVSEADLADFPFIPNNIIPERHVGHVPKLSPLCKKVVNATAASNRKSIYTQTDRDHRSVAFGKESKGTFAEGIPSRKFDKSCSNLPSVENAFSRTLENFVTERKPMFHEYVNAKRTLHDPYKYGELLVFGCNGSPPPHLARKMQSKFVLRKRLNANGVKEAFSYVTSADGPQRTPRRNLSVSYCASNNRSVVVEYVRNKNTDMFQIGRYETSPVDFSVVDVNTGHRSRNGVSRFACRIIVDRHGGHEARVYAAAFDSTGNIFLGERGLTCVREGKMDGFTTNGVLIMHPDPTYRVWREVSVCGYIYPVRSPNVEPHKRPRLPRESNVLQDGTLIDLCGVTLLWRTPLGLNNAPKEECLKRLCSLLQNMVPECHLLKTPKDMHNKKEPYIFLCCGHIVGLSKGMSPNELEGWSCPACRCIGPISKLKVGKEPGFFTDRGFPSHAFRPCGHVTNLKTAQYWSNIQVPEHRIIETGFCPFCGTKLNSIKKYVELMVHQ